MKHHAIWFARRRRGESLTISKLRFYGMEKIIYCAFLLILDVRKLDFFIVFEWLGPMTFFSSLV
jgi:hypothetical protein